MRAHRLAGSFACPNPSSPPPSPFHWKPPPTTHLNPTPRTALRKLLAPLYENYPRRAETTPQFLPDESCGGIPLESPPWEWWQQLCMVSPFVKAELRMEVEPLAVAETGFSCCVVALADL